MYLLTSTGIKQVKSVRKSTSQKSQNSVWLYKLGDETYISRFQLKDGADVSKTPIDCFG